MVQIYNVYVHDKISAQPCPTLMMPTNGNINCDGTQITGAVCSFECNEGYVLNGSSERICLPTNEWSGSVTKCEPLHCERLTNPENGNIILPCATTFGTICNLQCSEGYYSNEVNPVQVCKLLNGNVKWSDPPKCNG